jgi:hypothetical protein
LPSEARQRQAKDGGEGQNRTGDTTIFSPRKGGNSGQPKTAAPDFIGVPASPQPLETTLSRYRLSPVCHPSSSCCKVLFGLHSRFPVSRSSTSVRHGDDQDSARLDSIDDAERKALKQVPARSVIERRPGVREAHDRGFRGIHFTAECCGRCYAALRVPARGCFCLLESFFEVFKLEGQDRLPRGCDDAPPTMESSWRCQRRLDRAASESRQTTPLRRRRLLRLRDFESARPRVRLALRRKVEELQPGAAWRPYRTLWPIQGGQHYGV